MLRCYGARCPSLARAAVAAPPVLRVLARRRAWAPTARAARLHTRAIAAPLAPPSIVPLPRGQPLVLRPVAPPPPLAPFPEGPATTVPVVRPSAPAFDFPAPLAVRLWRSYLANLQRRPLMTKAATSFACTLLGDSIAQAVGGMPYSALRAVKLAGWAATVGSTSGHAWHRWLEATVIPERPRSAAAVGIKLLLDQVCLTPVMTALYFVFLKAVLEGSPHLVIPFIQDKLVPTLLAGYCVWPVANIVMLRFIPQDLRILFGSALGLAWGVFLSCSCVNGGGGATAASTVIEVATCGTTAAS